MHPIHSECHSALRAAAIQTKLDRDVHERHLAKRLIQSILGHQSTLNILEQAALTTVLLSQTNSAEERASVQKHAVNILLQADNLALCLICFSEQLVNFWVMANSERAFNSCPKTVQAWKAGGCVGSILILARIAGSLEHKSESDKLKILSGNTNNRLHRMMPVFLSQDTNAWNTLSPAWIGRENGTLRKKVIDIGWTPKHLMGMTFSAIWSPPEHWLGNIRYPYSIAVCKWITDVLCDGPLTPDPDGYFDTALTMSASACPRDAALAQMLLENSPVPLVYRLVRHPSTTRLDNGLLRMIAAVVQLQATVYGMESLSQAVCEGTLFPQNIETFGIDELV